MTVDPADAVPLPCTGPDGPLHHWVNLDNRVLQCLYCCAKLPFLRHPVHWTGHVEAADPCTDQPRDDA